MVTRNRKPLTKLARKILLFIQTYYQKHHYAPSVAEIVEGVGACNVTVIKYRRLLQRCGFLQKTGSLSRTAVPVHFGKVIAKGREYYVYPIADERGMAILPEIPWSTERKAQKDETRTRRRASHRRATRSTA